MHLQKTVKKKFFEGVSIFTINRLRNRHIENVFSQMNEKYLVGPNGLVGKTLHWPC